MRVIVVGLGIQGHKRRNIAGDECVAVVDPYHKEADYKSVKDVPLSDFDAALVCTPDGAKVEILSYLLNSGKHVLVEKPMLCDGSDDLRELASLAAKNNVTCYTAYNHRFEPHFVKMKAALDEGLIGEVYSARMFYGNGTARLVRESEWRDCGAGVLPDLGSHLLDTFLFWFGLPDVDFEIVTADNFENNAFDNCTFVSKGKIKMHAEVSLLSWRNNFYAEIFGSQGSAHIQSLCKWGPSGFTIRDRKLPSGRPDEEVVTLTQDDPTWAAEYVYFKETCKTSTSNLDNDIWINDMLNHMSKQALQGKY